nr:hypothetical protein [Lysinibacillus timonensis]
MKKPVKLFTSLFLSLFLLVACNTAEQSTGDVPNENGQTANNGSNIEQPNGSVNDNETEPEQTDTTDEVSSITYTSNGEQETQETSLKTSKEQNFSIQVLPSFSLTAEEPGKDMLYLTDNDAITMRIEYKSKDDTDFQNLVKETEELMSAVNVHVGYEEIDIQSFIDEELNITNFKAFQVVFNDQVVTGIVFEKDDELVRLTIFDNKLVDLTEAMIKMGLTITKAN